MSLGLGEHLMIKIQCDLGIKRVTCDDKRELDLLDLTAINISAITDPDGWPMIWGKSLHLFKLHFPYLDRANTWVIFAFVWNVFSGKLFKFFNFFFFFSL